MPDISLIASLIGGFVIMALAGEFLVSGAVALARRVGVSPLLAGIFIVGFGTSAPEMLVSLNAAIDGSPGLALGNIVGSNIANVFLVLAIPALLATLSTGGAGQTRSLIAMWLATALWIGLTALFPLEPWIGYLFIGALIAYSISTFIVTKRDVVAGNVPAGAEAESGISLGRALAYVPLGIGGLVIGANLIVDGGVGIAQYFGISEEIIGLTLLAVGTSLPEIGAGVAAALKGRGEVLIGNVMGSNLFNIFGAGGIVAFFGPVSVPGTFPQLDHWVMALGALILGGFILTKARVSRLAAVLLLLMYAVYIYALVNGFNILGLFIGVLA